MLLLGGRDHIAVPRLINQRTQIEDACSTTFTKINNNNQELELANK